MAQKQIYRTRVFDKNLDALYAGKRYIVNEGGSSSSKTFSVIQLFISLAESLPNRSFTVCSRSLPHLKQGALRDFLNIMHEWDLYSESEHNKTDQVYMFPNGSYIEFIGLEDPGKARGPRRDVLFINEANMISKDLFDQLNIRTRKKVFIDLNPADFECWCYKIADSDEAVKIHSTYKDNPHLPPEQVRVIEGYRRADPEGLMWKVFGLGLRGASEETIYTHWKIADLPGKGNVYYGLDFGYNNPTAMVMVEQYDGGIYVRELLYETGLTTSDLIVKLKEMGLSNTAEIYADSAEPKTIEEIYRAGFNIQSSDKDVTEGIRCVKSMPLFISPDSENLKRELSRYKWKKDKNGKILDEPVKEYDHLCDAIRYAVFTRAMMGTAEFFMM